MSLFMAKLHKQKSFSHSVIEEVSPVSLYNSLTDVTSLCVTLCVLDVRLWQLVVCR